MWWEAAQAYDDHDKNAALDHDEYVVFLGRVRRWLQAYERRREKTLELGHTDLSKSRRALEADFKADASTRRA